MQKYFPLIIANAQQPQIFTGLNIIDLDLVAFAKVIHKLMLAHTILQNNFVLFYICQVTRTVITYYMMFKRLAR